MTAAVAAVAVAAAMVAMVMMMIDDVINILHAQAHPKLTTWLNTGSLCLYFPSSKMAGTCHHSYLTQDLS